VPSYFVLVWVRALRWRHLTDPIRPLPNAALSRATAVGFMVNNLFPLRMGEVARCWYLSRETGISAAATFGTVILERVIDTLAVIAMVLLVVPLRAHASDAGLTRGALFLVPVAVLPILFLWGLRARPALVLALVRACARPFPARLGMRAERLLGRFAGGLGALRGGRHLLWIAWHTLVIWLVISVVPILAAFAALGIDLSSAWRNLVAAWTTQAAIGVAVALPSSPGFFGLFHYACRVALVRSGVALDTAVAAGTLIHSVMWLTLTAMGLCVLRWRRTRLFDVEGPSADACPGAPPPAPPRG
jgi:uncharacterized protein (TIRG00374 family)